MMKLYLVSEKGTETNYKKDVMTLDKVFEQFKPNEEFVEEFEAWKEAVTENTAEAAQEFVDNYVNDNDGIHYHDYMIEEWN